MQHSGQRMPRGLKEDINGGWVSWIGSFSASGGNGRGGTEKWLKGSRGFLCHCGEPRCVDLTWIPRRGIQVKSEE